MFGVNPKRQEPGQPIAARTINALVEQVSRLARLTVGTGLKIAYVKGIPVISLGELHVVRDVYTTSTITARSGNTVGTGTAKFVYLRGTPARTLAYTNEPQFTIVNTLGGTVSSGVFGYASYVSGEWRLIAADCSGLAGTPATT